MPPAMTGYCTVALLCKGPGPTCIQVTAHLEAKANSVTGALPHTIPTTVKSSPLSHMHGPLHVWQPMSAKLKRNLMSTAVGVAGCGVNGWECGPCPGRGLACGTLPTSALYISCSRLASCSSVSPAASCNEFSRRLRELLPNHLILL
jgi:hypothetical protein